MSETAKNEKTVEVPKKRGLGLPKILIFVGVVAVVVFGVMWLVTGGFKDQNSNEVITEKVGKHILLPDEAPEITTIENAGQLTSQPFFSKVKDGDKILIFTKSARIMVYRPSENILVNVGPIVDDSSTTTDASKTE